MASPQNRVGDRRPRSATWPPYVPVNLECSGSAAGRAVDRPLQPIIAPPSLTHIAQVCGGWTIKDPVNAKRPPGLAEVLEQTPPTAK
jgi:hypothetical protein